MRRLCAVLCLLVAAGLTSGCFVIDELDAGQDLMAQHRKHGTEEEEAAKPEAEDTSPGLVAKVKDWWNGLGSEPTEHSSSGPPPHPDDVLGTCDLGGSLTFTRKFDCIRRGGEFEPRRKSGS